MIRNFAIYLNNNFLKKLCKINFFLMSEAGNGLYVENYQRNDILFYDIPIR